MSQKCLYLLKDPEQCKFLVEISKIFENLVDSGQLWAGWGKFDVHVALRNYEIGAANCHIRNPSTDSEPQRKICT